MFSNMSDSSRNDLSIHKDECDRNTSNNHVQDSNTFNLANIKRTIDVKSSTGTFIFHKGATSSRIRFVNDYQEEYASVSTLKQLKSICKKTDTLMTGISSKFLLNRNIRNKRKHFGKIKSKNSKPLKVTKNCSDKAKSKKSTSQLPKIQNYDDVSEDTDSDSVICLGILDVTSSNITKNKTSKNICQNSSLILNNSNNLNENDLMIVKQYCNICGKDLNMEYHQISDKHKCPGSAKNLKRTKLTNDILSLQKEDVQSDNLELQKIHNIREDSITTTTTVRLSSTTSLSLNVQSNSRNNDRVVHNNLQTSTPVVTHDTSCNTSNVSLFFNDKNVIDALKKKVLEFLDKKCVQANDTTFPTYDNNYNPYVNAINKEGTGENNQLVTKICNNYYGLNNSFEDNNIYGSSDIVTPLYVDDRFERDFIDNTRENYIFGYNYYGSRVRKKRGLRMIVIDGSNVALGHSKGKFFSSEGLRICIDYFYQRGHEVKAFVPQFRLKNGQTSNKELLQWLYNRGWIIFTPSRDVNGRMIVPYDDRFIVQCAALHDAVIVSNDCYRDLIKENVEWKKTIENNLLMVTWVDDVIYFPTDPLGKWGPTLESFLRYS